MGRVSKSKNLRCTAVARLVGVQAKQGAMLYWKVGFEDRCHGVGVEITRCKTPICRNPRQYQTPIAI